MCFRNLIKNLNKKKIYNVLKILRKISFYFQIKLKNKK